MLSREVQSWCPVMYCDSCMVQLSRNAHLPQRSAFANWRWHCHCGHNCTQVSRGCKMALVLNDFTSVTLFLASKVVASFVCDVLLQIVKKVELEAQRAKGPNEAKGGRRRRNPVEDLKREVAIMRTLRHKNIVSLQVSLAVAVSCLPVCACILLPVLMTWCGDSKVDTEDPILHPNAGDVTGYSHVTKQSSASLSCDSICSTVPKFLLYLAALSCSFTLLQTY